MSAPTPPQRTIVTATLSSIYITGALSSISLLTIPSLAQSPSTTTLISQLKTLYRLDRFIHAPTVLATSLLWFIAAYQTYAARIRAPGGNPGWKSLALAGTCLLGVLGFERVVMEPVARALVDEMHYHERDLERNDGVDEAGLLRRWGRLNWGRVGLVAVAGGIGMGGLI
jgi:hypothetical protein